MKKINIDSIDQHSSDNSQSDIRIPFIDYKGDPRIVDKCDRQDSGTLMAPLNFFEMHQLSFKSEDLLKLNYQYSDVEKMVHANPQLGDDYKSCIRAMLTIEQLLKQLFRYFPHIKITVDQGTNVFPNIVGLQNFSIKVQSDTDVVVMSFNYCDSESNEEVSDGDQFYKGTIEIALTQLSGNNVVLFQFQNIAYDKLSEAVNKFTELYLDGYKDYFGDYAAFIEKLVNLVSVLKLEELEADKNCGEVVKRAQSLINSIEELERCIEYTIRKESFLWTLNDHSKKVNSYLRNIERIESDPLEKSDWNRGEDIEIEPLGDESFDGYYDDVNGFDGPWEVNDVEFDLNDYNVGYLTSVAQNFEKLVFDLAWNAECIYSAEVEIDVEEDDTLSEINFIARVLNKEADCMMDFKFTKSLKTNKESVTTIFSKDGKVIESRTYDANFEFLYNYLELINTELLGDGHIPDRTPRTGSEVMLMDQLTRDLGGIFYPEE